MVHAGPDSTSCRRHFRARRVSGRLTLAFLSLAALLVAAPARADAPSAQTSNRTGPTVSDLSNHFDAPALGVDASTPEVHVVADDDDVESSDPSDDSSSTSEHGEHESVAQAVHPPRRASRVWLTTRHTCSSIDPAAFALRGPPVSF
jgi:hypothetical protein